MEDLLAEYEAAESPDYLNPPPRERRRATVRVRECRTIIGLKDDVFLVTCYDLDLLRNLVLALPCLICWLPRLPKTKCTIQVQYRTCGALLCKCDSILG